MSLKDFSIFSSVAILFCGVEPFYHSVRDFMCFTVIVR